MDELYLNMDINGDKTVTIQELVIACSPDIDNNKIYDQAELSIGLKTVRIWLASILVHDRTMLADGLIDKKEMKDLFSRITWPLFFKTNSEEIKDEYKDIFIEVDNMLKKSF